MAIVSPKYDVFLDDVVMQPVPQVDSDPASPSAEDAWVLAQSSGGGGGGSPIGLLLAFTEAGSVGYSYTFKYRTKEGTTVSVNLT